MANTLIRTKCEVCGRIARESNRTVLHRTQVTDWQDSPVTVPEELEVPYHRYNYKFLDEEYAVSINLECGHSIVREMDKADESVEIESIDGRKPFQFQWDTAQFMERAGLEGLILHEQGLGKTVIACMLLKRNRKAMTPCLYVCPSGLREQVHAEIIRWTGIIPEIISTSSQVPDLKWFPVTIVSIDTLRLVRPDLAETVETDDSLLTPRERMKKARGPLWTDELIGKYKVIIMDESQKIKNTGSSRTKAFRGMVKLGNSGKKAKVICMSGTNIEKHAGEYFVTLNSVRPELFHHESEYQARWCKVDPDTGKIGGLRNVEKFRELTSDFIIRYRRAEVLPDLPPVFRQFKKAEIMEKDVIKEYNKVLSEFQDFMENDSKKKTPTDILGYLTTMRRITGIAKVPQALAHIEEFLLENEDDRKITVFLHHKTAGSILMSKLTELCKDGGFNPPLYLNGEQDLHEKTRVVKEFAKPGNRILLASTLAAGVGLNLQFCSDCLIMERQWNPSAEEQAEGRFPRPGRGADMPNIINAVYLIAAGTIDDFLTTIVEEKRNNVKQTLDGESTTWDERSLLTELTRALTTANMLKWRL